MNRTDLNPTEMDVLLTIEEAGKPLGFHPLLKRMREKIRTTYSEASLRTALGTLGREGFLGYQMTDTGRRELHEQKIKRAAGGDS